MIVWWWNIALFRTVPWLASSPPLGQNTPSTELFSPKNHVLLSNFFFFKYVIYYTVLSKYLKKKKAEVTGLVSSQTALVIDSEITLRMENWRDGDWDKTQIGAHVMRRKGCAMHNRGITLRGFIGESLFTLFASLTYAYHYLMTLIK